ncbi:MAG: four helix bundle protein [bacterium]
MRESPEQLDWERQCPLAITSDVIWKLDAYRASLFLQHLSLGDLGALKSVRPQATITEQLATAVGSISANLAEGYSRSTRADRLRFLGYSLGSTRESIVWYQGARGTLADEIVNDRLALLTRIRSLLLGLIRSTRGDIPLRPRLES